MRIEKLRKPHCQNSIINLRFQTISQINILSPRTFCSFHCLCLIDSLIRCWKILLWCSFTNCTQCLQYYNRSCSQRNIYNFLPWAETLNWAEDIKYFECIGNGVGVSVYAHILFCDWRWHSITVRYQLSSTHNVFSMIVFTWQS